jgi:hypothetical protein
MEHVTVWRDPGSFAAWPFSHGLWAYPDGEVVAGFTRAPCRYEQPVDVQHWVVDPVSEQVTVRSTDGGRTWDDGSLAVTASHHELERAWFDGAMPAAPASAPDWTAPGFCMTTGFAVPPARAQNAGYVQYSHDRGRTWDGPFVVPSFSFAHVQVKSHYVVRGDGVVLLFVTVGREEAPPHALHYGRIGSRFVVVYASPDAGLTWRYLSSILPGTPDARFVERYYASPALLPDGQIVAALRCQLDGANAWPELYASEDGGWTWRYRSRIADWGSPTDLVCLRDGRLLAVYGRRTPPFGIRARVSEDGGRTWLPELVLRDDGGSFDLGYPRVAELPNGDAIATYYFNAADDPVQCSGGVRHIAATIFAP